MEDVRTKTPQQVETCSCGERHGHCSEAGATSQHLSKPTTLGLQIARSRPHLHALGTKVGIIYIHGAPG